MLKALLFEILDRISLALKRIIIILYWLTLPVRPGPLSDRWLPAFQWHWLLSSSRYLYILFPLPGFHSPCLVNLRVFFRFTSGVISSEIASRTLLTLVYYSSNMVTKLSKIFLMCLYVCGRYKFFTCKFLQLYVYLGGCVVCFPPVLPWVTSKLNWEKGLCASRLIENASQGVEVRDQTEGRKESH